MKKLSSTRMNNHEKSRKTYWLIPSNSYHDYAYLALNRRPTSIFRTTESSNNGQNVRKRGTRLDWCPYPNRILHRPRICNQKPKKINFPYFFSSISMNHYERILKFYKPSKKRGFSSLNPHYGYRYLDVCLYKFTNSMKYKILQGGKDVGAYITVVPRKFVLESGRNHYING